MNKENLGFELDEIGHWSELKIEILNRYASEYNRILLAQQYIKKRIYIDAFSGAGIHYSKEKEKLVPGSATIALNVHPPFTHFHFIDLNKDKLNFLRENSLETDNVKYHSEDCNEVLLKKILPTIRYENYERALLLLDPYGLHLDWKVIEMAGKSKVIEIFLNFPIMDMNRNVFRKDQTKVDESEIGRMNKFWGDNSWRSAAFNSEETLFGFEEVKNNNQKIVEEFRKRLKEVAGFSFVPEPIPMKNGKGATVYYIFFASPNKTADKIVKYIFNKYRN
ncbi:three-Cys-motif partner protein TcmP [Leptospira jelokensis]|uniref:three-Cys-motif partner protein TcmP n=1 Tax=Leptospira jelokensis TaxID=2484931 RepID=UPI001090F622|nr:three-Cys-motif partner protein TcmP [Leptospira jelokensis]TGL97954.1 three-Cys-motif partner protein TcmP [Leptospira jelokensis]